MELSIVSAPPPLASRPPAAGAKRSVPSPPSAPPPTIPATRLGPPPAPPERVRSFLQHGFGRIRAAGNEGVHAPRFCVACVAANLLMMLVEFGVNGWRIEPLSTNWSVGVSAETLVRLGAKVTSYIVWRGEWWCAAWASNPRAAEEGPVIGSSRARVPVGTGGCSRRRGCMEASFTCSSTSPSSGSSARPWSARAAAGGMGPLACPRRGPICKPAGPRDSARSCCILASLDAAAASEPRLRPSGPQDTPRSQVRRPRCRAALPAAGAVRRHLLGHPPPRRTRIGGANPGLAEERLPQRTRSAPCRRRSCPSARARRASGW